MKTSRSDRRRGTCPQFQPLEPRTLFSLVPSLGFGLPNVTPVAVASDVSGNVYVAGTFSGTVDFNLSRRHVRLLDAKLGGAFLVKYSSVGTLAWVEQSPAPINGIAVDDSGNVYACGTFRGATDFNLDPNLQNTVASSGRRDAYVAKYRANGTFVWANKIGGAIDNEIAYAVAVDSRGFVHVSGIVATPEQLPSISQFLAQFNARGRNAYDDRFGDPTFDTYVAGMAVDKLGNTYLAGSGHAGVDFDPSSAFAHHLPDRSNFLLKLDPQGALGWVLGTDYGDGDPSTYQGLAADSSGVYLTGYYDASPDFDPSPNRTFVLPGQGAFVAKYSSTGAFAFANGMTGLHAIGRHVSVDPATADIVVTGGFLGDISVADGTRQIPLTVGGDGVFLAHYTGSGGVVDAGAVSTLYDFRDSPDVASSPRGFVIGGLLPTLSTTDWDPGPPVLNLGNGFVVKYRFA